MSVEVDLGQFVAGGYFITKPVARPDFLSKSSGPELPEMFFSLSDCLAEFLPDSWAYEGWSTPLDQESEARKWGIESDRVNEIVEWVKSRHIAGEMGWISVFFDLEAPREFLRRFNASLTDLVLVGIGLHRSDAPRFTIAEKPERDDINPGGEFAMISRGFRLADGGTPLGFEPLVIGGGGGGQFHTWLCTSLHEYAFVEKGICPNTNGLLDNHEDARWVAECINEGKVNAEPGLYLPWLVMTYPLK